MVLFFRIDFGLVGNFSESPFFQLLIFFLFFLFLHLRKTWSTCWRSISPYFSFSYFESIFLLTIRMIKYILSNLLNVSFHLLFYPSPPYLPNLPTFPFILVLYFQCQQLRLHLEVKFYANICYITINVDRRFLTFSQVRRWSLLECL